MVEENKDVLDQLVDGPGVNQPTTEQGVEGQVAADESLVEGQPAQDEQQVPYERFKEVNEQRKAAEEAKALAEQQLQQTRDQMALQPQVQPQKTVSTYEQALTDCQLLDEEFLTQEQQIRVNARHEQLINAKNQQAQANQADLQFAQSHPDFVKAVGYLNPQGHFVASAELNKILMEKPYLRGSCVTAQGAYEIVMQERKLAELSQQTTTLKAHQTRQNVDGNLAPMSPAATGGGAVERKGKITKSSSAEDIRAMEQRVKSGEFE